MFVCMYACVYIVFAAAVARRLCKMQAQHLQENVPAQRECHQQLIITSATSLLYSYIRRTFLHAARQ